MDLLEWSDELISVIEQYSKLFEEESKKMFSVKKKDIPIILAYKEGVDWCQNIVNASSETYGWNFAITTLKEMVKIGGISERAGEVLTLTTKDPHSHFHVCNAEINKVNLRSFPFKIEEKEDNLIELLKSVAQEIDISALEIGMSKYFTDIDKIVDEVIKQYYTIHRLEPLCKNGCSNCCYYHLELSPIEALITFIYFCKNYDKKVLLRLKHKVYTVDSFARSIHKRVCSPDGCKLDDRESSEYLQFMQEYNKSNIPCVFLENDTCIVYPFRPLVCRFQLNFYDKDRCRPERNLNIFEKKDKMFNMISIDKDIVEEIMEVMVNIHEINNLDYGFATIYGALPVIMSSKLWEYFRKD